MERAERIIALGIGLAFSVVLVPVLWLMLVLTSITAVQRFVMVWRQASDLGRCGPRSIAAGGRWREIGAGQRRVRAPATTASVGAPGVGAPAPAPERPTAEPRHARLPRRCPRSSRLLPAPVARLAAAGRRRRMSRAHARPAARWSRATSGGCTVPMSALGARPPCAAARSPPTPATGWMFRLPRSIPADARPADVVRRARAPRRRAGGATAPSSPCPTSVAGISAARGSPSRLSAHRGRRAARAARAVRVVRRLPALDRHGDRAARARAPAPRCSGRSRRTASSAGVRPRHPGTGVEVEFFGERTTLPAARPRSPSAPARRWCPSRVYFRERRRATTASCDRRSTSTRQGTLREDVARITQALAHELETLIRRAPEQWHLLQPNWPSDRAVTVMGVRVGLVCPYSLTIPGGVQGQVLGLARELRVLGHEVRVLGPCDGPPPDAGVTPLGRSIPFASNGRSLRSPPTSRARCARSAPCATRSSTSSICTSRCAPGPR